jgi:HNH endonuclease/AP2 domain
MPVLNPPPSLDRLRELFSYNPETGLFTRIVRQPRSKFPSGTVAGTKVTDGYTAIKIDGRVYRAHRLAWLMVYGKWPSQLDHINRDPADNRIANLRPATPALNALNRGPRAANRSGVAGVCNDARLNLWRATIRVNGKFVSLGYFKEREQAVAARAAAFQTEMTKHLINAAEQLNAA